jgi:hypothetical protein
MVSAQLPADGFVRLHSRSLFANESITGGSIEGKRGLLQF